MLHSGQTHRNVVWFALAFFPFTMLLFANTLKAEVEVKVRNFEFFPRDITVPRGETVKWVWEEGFHTTTNGTGSSDPEAGTLWNEPMSSSNKTFSFMFNEEGLFPYFCIPHESIDMKGTITVEAPAGVGDGAGKGGGSLPRAIEVSQNYPNPFNPSTSFTVRIQEGEPQELALKVYSLRGLSIKTIYTGRISGGEYSFVWDGRSEAGEALPSGIYLYSVKYGDQVITKKMTMLK